MNDVWQSYFTPRTIKRPDGCIVWTRSTNLNGYGHLACQRYFPKKMVLAHRFSWFLTHGTMPVGLCVLHRCDVRTCVNPDHLFLGTNRDNCDDMMRKGRHKRGDVKRHDGLWWQTKLSVDQALAIRTAIRKKEKTQKALAEEYGVTVNTIGRISTGRGWKCLDFHARQRGES